MLAHRCLAPAPSNEGIWGHTTWVRSALSQDVTNLGPHDVGQIGVVTGRDELSRSSFPPFSVR